MPFCKICKKHMMFEASHKCPPSWEIWDEESWGDDYQICYGIDAEDAGEHYAEDYILADGGEHEIKIRKLGEKDWTTYILSAEATVNYYAHLK